MIKRGNYLFLTDKDLKELFGDFEWVTCNFGRETAWLQAYITYREEGYNIILDINYNLLKGKEKYDINIFWEDSVVNNIGITLELEGPLRVPQGTIGFLAHSVEAKNHFGAFRVEEGDPEEIVSLLKTAVERMRIMVPGLLQAIHEVATTSKEEILRRLEK